MARISDKTIALMEGADLRISPMVLIELEYLHEIGRVELSSREVQMKVEHEVGVRICNFPFASVARVAIDEKWTRDPFDRVIVAQAKLNGFSPLVSADEIIHQHYTMALS
jgi:PIN domain nuclease of toxin-antitoxin system